MEYRIVTTFLAVRSTSGSVQVPRPGHFRLEALGGPTPVDFFYPHNTVHSHGIPNRPPMARSHSGAAHLNFLHAHSTQTNPLVSSTPIHTNLARSAQRPDHGRRQSHFLLLPASTAPCPEHFQAKALGDLTGTNRAARTHLFSLVTQHTTFSAKSQAFSSYSNIFFRTIQSIGSVQRSTVPSE